MNKRSRKPMPASGLFSGLESLEERRLLSADLFGSSLRIEGTDANDVIVIEAGENDGQVVLTGVDGVEDGTVFSGVDRIGVRLGDGDDSATVLGAMRTTDGAIMAIRIAGNFGDDRLFGGDSLDTFLGGPGDDLLEGGSHDDELRGGAGFDDLFGGDGDDLIHGGRDGDNVRGHGGTDRLFGGRGFDEVNGGGGSDIIFGGWGADQIIGGAGSDAIHGDRGNDVIRGGSGGDEIHGDDGADEVLGGIGQDWLFGGEGDDTIAGGAGSDTILAPPAEIQDASDEDAKWVDSVGNELDFSEFTDSFWSALGTVSDALRSGNVDRIDSTLEELAGVLNDQAEAFFDLLGEIVDDAPVEQGTFTEFQETVSGVADGVDGFFEDLANDVVDDSSDTGDTGDSGSTTDLSFLAGENVPPSFLEAIDILKGVVGDNLPSEFWESARRLLDNHDRFLDRLDSLTETLSPELLDGLKDRVDVFMETIFNDGFDPRVDADAFEDAVEARLAVGFADLSLEQRDALRHVILAGARRDSAAESVERQALELAGGVLPESFWQAWERAGNEASGIVDGEFPDEFQRAIDILNNLLGGEIPGTFWDRFDAFRSAIFTTDESFENVLASMDDVQRLALAPWVWELVDQLLDADYQPGADIAALMGTIDPEVAARFDGATDTTMAAIRVMLDAGVREYELEDAVFEVVLDLLGGVLPENFIDAWEDAGDDISDEFDLLYQPHVPPSFIESVEILKSVVEGDLPEEFWDLANRLLDNQGRFMDRLGDFMSSLEPELLDGVKDRVDLFMQGLFDDGFDPRVDRDAFEAELAIRLNDVFQDLTLDQREALGSAIRAGLRRDSAVEALETFALELAGGELPPEFWDAWQRAGDEANGLVDGVFPPQFEAVIELLAGSVDGEIPGEFWDRFDTFLFSRGDIGFAFEQVLETLSGDQESELMPFIFGFAEALIDAGYQPGEGLEAMMAQIDPDLAARFEGMSQETSFAIESLIEAKIRAQQFEDGVLEIVGQMFGGVISQEFMDAWVLALDLGDNGDGTDDGDGVSELVGLDGVMPQEFFAAIELAQTVIAEPLSPEFFAEVEQLVLSVGSFAARFGEVMATLDQIGQEQLAFPILDINNMIHDLGYRGDSDDLVETYIVQLDPALLAIVNGASDATRQAMFALFAEGANRENLADDVEDALMLAAGDAMPDEFFSLWDLAGDQMLGT